MATPFKALSLINLFVEDLEASRTFYSDVFGLEYAFGDEYAAAYKLGDVLINLLVQSSAAAQIAPAKVASQHDGARVQFAIVVDDVDAQTEHLRNHDVTIINGPTDMPWGMRTVTFADPAGHIWEFAQPIG